MPEKSRQQKLIDRAERFAAGCKRTRLELQLVDEIHRLNDQILKLTEVNKKQDENIYLLLKEGYGNG